MLISRPDAEPAVLLAHAWRLSEPTLVYRGSSPLDSDLLSTRNKVDRLAGLLRLELPRLTFEDSCRWVTRALRDAPTEWDSVRELAQRCVRFEAGRPAAAIGVLEDRLRRIVQADVLVCWHLAQRGWDPFEPGASARLDWSATLASERSVFDPVLCRAMAENHCHLGGTVSTAVMWVFALCGDAPVRGLFTGAGTPAQDAWDRSGDVARRAVLRLETVTRPGTASAAGPTVAEGRAAVDPIKLRRVLGWTVVQQLQATQERPTPPWRMSPLELEVEKLRWPIGEWVIGGRASLSVLAGERLLVWRALRVLAMAADAASKREAMRVVGEPLLAYLRIKNAFHQALLLGRYGRGLFAFDRTFQRRSFYFAPAAGTGPARAQVAEALERRRVGLTIDAFLEDALGHGGPGLLANLPPLDLELRVTPEGGPTFVRTLRGWLRGVRDAMERWRKPPLRVGFVLHAIKKDSETWWDDLRVQMEGVRYLMDEQPGLRRLLVGIDVAGAERNRPPRDCASFFREVRSNVQRQDPAGSPFSWRPGFTVHVGEDFPDLLTGLRHVDEAAHLLCLRPNDRLGHALALGWDVDAFYDSAQGPCVSLRERILDLLWLLYLATASRDALRDEAFWLRQTIANIVSQSLDGDTYSGRLIDAAVDRIGAQFCETPWRDESELLEAKLLRILRIPTARWEEELPVPVDDPEHRRCVRAAQRIVWKRVHKKGLIIEGNPTSNLLIGDFTAYTDLPVVRQGKAPGLTEDEDLPQLRVTINTDNPGIFDTTLRSEYVRVGEAVLERGEGADAVEVSAWLDTIRKNGLAASFIPDDVPRGGDFVRLLEEVIGT
ncbi:MAG: hypothetical protein GY856_17580 [bacterium]|nr:hypothetical protein [bacterium]